jgi:uncharacterized protein YbaR (Trm112 family)
MWIVKNKRCPCDCGGNGVLAYLVCPQCRKVVLVCDEIGNVFDDLSVVLNSAPLVLWRSSGQLCPKCSNVLLADFEAASEADLLACHVNLDTIEAADDQVQRSVKHHAD